MATNEDAPQPLDTPNGFLDNEDSSVDPAFAAQIQQKYVEERDKRIRKDGVDQFAALDKQFQDFARDVWDEQDSKTNGHIESSLPVENGSSCLVMVIGAGFGGLCAAVRLLQAGIPLEKICIVDPAAGFGGTWYWNRYPGLMCDVESYIYMPLLEEMDWMPKHKYAYGPELHAYAEAIADKWHLRSRALLRTKVTDMDWDSNTKHWNVTMRHRESPFSMEAQFVVANLGVLSTPQFPLLEGIRDFTGHMFHTSRWDYNCTGGTSSDPAMTNLRDKRVGIIGTGATAVQCIPHLAAWSKELYVFQRTPSSIERRDQQATDPGTWAKEIASKKGWQRERQANFNKFITNSADPTDPNLVDDGWTWIPSYSVLTGGPNKFARSIEEENEEMRKLDLRRSERVRRRVDEIVKDKTTGDDLKAWYETWCKRPCFHDDYLPTFNQPNVALIDTKGQGVDRITDKGIVYAGKEYELDVIVCATGFTSPGLSMSLRSGFTITGSDGLTLDESWEKHGAHTLHGMLSRGFPNLFLMGPAQTGVSANFSFILDQLAQHAAYIISRCCEHEKRSENGKEASSIAGLQVEPSAEAENDWSERVASMAMVFAPIAGCTPGYINKQGGGPSSATTEDKIKMARRAVWGLGGESFVEILGRWRAQGDMSGLKMTF